MIGVAKEGISALYTASENGHKEVVKLLIEAGVNIFKTKNGHAEVVKLLIKAGADINIKTDEEALLRAVLEGIRKCELGPTAPCVGTPMVVRGGKLVTKDDLHEVFKSLHDGMPLALRRAPMRLLKIDAVLGWPTIKVYEEVINTERLPPADVSGSGPLATAAECLEVPYSVVTEEQWAQTLVISWRWGGIKPVQQLPSFTPMSEQQFRELTQVLKQAKGSGLKFVWIDWSCVPQYSDTPSVVEVLRSKVFYIRARAMAIIPTFQPLPDDGVTRALISRVRDMLKRRSDDQLLNAIAAAVLGAILEKDAMAGREHFARVWTLAERMARHGRREQLNHWLSLEAWLGMVVDAMLRSTEDKSASQVYRKILGKSAGSLLDAIMAPLVKAIKTRNMHLVDGLEDKVAELFCTAVSVWQSVNTLEEVPTKAWLRLYLLETDLGVYQAWSEADRVWAIYSYYCWKKVDWGSPEGLALALRGLVQIAADGDDDPKQIFAAVARKLGLRQVEMSTTSSA
ncbi:hypothetical protein TSOC_010163 [Tetrabaena socialis]|uniref:Heterokaryon incompatibility domain-containing protein n=1 Tax=Tetrabaena socialis TaxID=47790 RepID=A0A2J7ZU02_9CHLO|nr:hypothetical protein TSOC_010163 [Tetrabaena socialis]|eukprot:PNH03753.1 hypothetical protein TSOC_010163 [Tetrabaena socialis]